MKKIFIYVFIGICLVSCGRKTDSEAPKLSTCGISILDDTYAYFCTPYDLNVSKPLVLINTSNGWVARYGGSEASDSLTLRPVAYIDQFEDSSFYFEEYYAGKRNGKYVFDNEYVDLNPDFTTFYYVTENGTDSIRYFATRVAKAAVVSNPFDLSDDDLALLGEPFDETLLEGRLLYDIYSNPEATLRDGLPYKDVFSTLSSDGKVRIYNYYFHLNGNGHGNLIDFSLIQYRTEDGISCISNFANIQLDFVLEDDSYEYNFIHADTFQIFTATTGKSTNYLIETTWWDEVPVNVGSASQEKYMDNVVSLMAYKIHKGKIAPVNLFDNAPIIVRVATSGPHPLHFIYDEPSRTIKIPHVDDKTLTFMGEYDTFNI